MFSALKTIETLYPNYIEGMDRELLSDLPTPKDLAQIWKEVKPELDKSLFWKTAKLEMALAIFGLLVALVTAVVQLFAVGELATFSSQAGLLIFEAAGAAALMAIGIAALLLIKNHPKNHPKPKSSTLSASDTHSS